MGATDVDRLNPYAEPHASLEDPTKAPPPKTGFTTLQGLAIIAIATTLFMCAHEYQRSVWVARMRAAARRAVVPGARSQPPLNPPAKLDPPR